MAASNSISERKRGRERDYSRNTTKRWKGERLNLEGVETHKPSSHVFSPFLFPRHSSSTHCFLLWNSDQSVGQQNPHSFPPSGRHQRRRNSVLWMNCSEERQADDSQIAVSSYLNIHCLYNPKNCLIALIGRANLYPAANVSREKK